MSNKKLIILYNLLERENYGSIVGLSKSRTVTARRATQMLLMIDALQRLQQVNGWGHARDIADIVLDNIILLEPTDA